MLFCYKWFRCLVICIFFICIGKYDYIEKSINYNKFLIIFIIDY